MKLYYLILLLLILSCNNQADKTGDKIVDSPDVVRPAPIDTQPVIAPQDTSPIVYSNARFRNVIITKLPESAINVRGEGQIFEASFGWVVIQDQQEIQKGFNDTDAGAPAWGKFDFTIKLQEEQPGLKRRLLLFETSAKDGSRQHILDIPL